MANGEGSAEWNVDHPDYLSIMARCMQDVQWRQIEFLIILRSYNDTIPTLIISHCTFSTVDVRGASQSVQIQSDEFVKASDL